MGNKTDVVVKLVLVLFISLLSFAVGTYVGYDTARSMGKGETGGAIAAPIFRDFMKLALANKPAVPFRQPPGIKLVRINPKTGLRANSEPDAILEAFKPEEEPDDQYSIIGFENASSDAAADSEKAVRQGGGRGLY